MKLGTMKKNEVYLYMYSTIIDGIVNEHIQSFVRLSFIAGFFLRRPQNAIGIKLVFDEEE